MSLCTSFLSPLQTVSHRPPSCSRVHLTYRSVDESRVLTDEFRHRSLDVFGGGVSLGRGPSAAGRGAVRGGGCADDDVRAGVSLDCDLRGSGLRCALHV